MDADAADSAADTVAAADDRADAWEERVEERAEQGGGAAEERFEAEADQRDVTDGVTPSG